VKTSNLTSSYICCNFCCYSIAGHRIGKGEGYADLEFAMMIKMGAVDENTVIAATVHDCQVHIHCFFIPFFISKAVAVCVYHLFIY
jgi:5-formyltetrahydrofolate cyclo-ligase